MMAPYAIGHIKISFLLEELGHTLRDDERFKLYLTNTLDMEDLQLTQIPGLESLSDESHEAGKIKKDEPLLVILGNPPYSGISSNMTTWQQNLVKQNMDGALSYYEVDGKKLEEKKLWLQDDYVKFLRFAQWKIHKAGKGIVAMITNHSYLDNPTFRGMRQSLMTTFDEIFIIDLHGNSKKKETAPDGTKDVNVFDIQQGVAIAIFIKNSKSIECTVYHHELFGDRESKYYWLDSNDFKINNYQLLNPKSPWYFFIKRNTQGIEHYLDWKKVNEIFPVNVTGIVTARDNLAIDFNSNDLAHKINQFRDANIPDELIREIYGLPDNYQWKLKEQRTHFRKVIDWKEQITKILYRPFDIRFICYQENIVFRTRRDIMQNMKYPNLGFCFIRQFSGNTNYSHAFITDKMIDNRTFFSSKGIIQEAPLYIYRAQQRKKNSNILMNVLFEDETDYQTKRPNIENKTFEILEAVYEAKPTPEQILYYCYAILYSNKYREKYAEFLKIDFPRIPFTSDYNTFVTLAENGENLAQLHLLQHKSLDNPIIKFRGKGDFIIEKTEYKEQSQLLYINDNNYFEGLSIEMWEYQIGGYQIAKKWLTWRKGREVESKTYCKIMTAIAETIKLQSEIDVTFEILESSTMINFT
jgi:predicted helicase